MGPWGYRVRVPCARGQVFTSQGRHRLPLGLAEPPRHAHVAKHRPRGAQMLNRLRLLAGAPMEAAEAEVALRNERSHGERVGKIGRASCRERVEISVAAVS